MSGYVRIAALFWILSSLATPALAGEPSYHTAEGVVLGPDGNPVSGAQVSLYLRDHGKGIQPYKQVTTGVDGKYAFTVENEVANHPALIAVRKVGLAWSCRRWLLLADLEADIRLARATGLAGRVVDEQARPVAGARVSLQALRSDYLRSFHIPQELLRTLFTTETDAQGRFRFSELSSNWQTDFLIEAPGYGVFRSQHLPDWMYRVYAPGQEGIEFVLKPEARIRGRVVSEVDSAPLTGVEVRMGRTPTSLGHDFGSAVSDGDGAFSFRGIPEGEFWVGPATSYVPDTEWVAWPVSVQTKAGETAPDVKLELTRGGMFELKVVDSAGRPVDGAGLTIFNREGNRVTQGHSDATGSCRVRLPAGAHKLIEVRKRGYHLHEPDVFFDIELGQTVRRKILLREADLIEGIVVDVEGQLVPDVRLVLMPSQTDAVHTDKRGRFTMIWDKWLDDREKPRSTEFELIAMDRSGGRTGSVKLTNETGVIRLVLKPAVRVTGAVVNLQGQPVERALVSAWLRGDKWGMNLRSHRPILTDRTGRFTILPVPAGRTCEISVNAADYDKVKKEFQTPADATRPFDIGPIEVASKSAGDG